MQVWHRNQLLQSTTRGSTSAHHTSRRPAMRPSRSAATTSSTTLRLMRRAICELPLHVMPPAEASVTRGTCGLPACCARYEPIDKFLKRRYHVESVDAMQEDCSTTHECASPDVRTATYTFNNGAQNVQVTWSSTLLLGCHAGHHPPPDQFYQCG